MPGKRCSLIDLFYINAPGFIEGVTNICNLLSEHKGIKLNFHTQEKKLKPQFFIKCSYNKVTYDNLMSILEKNKKRGSSPYLQVMTQTSSQKYFWKKLI